MNQTLDLQDKLVVLCHSRFLPDVEKEIRDKTSITTIDTDMFEKLSRDELVAVMKIINKYFKQYMKK